MPRHLISDAHEWINEIPTFDDGARGEDLPLWASKGCYMMAGFLERVDKRRSRIIKDKGAPREALELLIHRPGTTFGG